MPTVYEKVANSFIDSSNEVRELFAPPPQEAETPFADYYQEKNGEDEWWEKLKDIPLDVLETLMTGAEQTFSTFGSLATRGFGARPMPETKYGQYDPRRLVEHLPGGAEYKAYQAWKEKQKPFWNLPSWLGLLGEILEVGQAEVFEMAPLAFMGGGAAKKPLEQVVDYTSKQLLKGKTAEESIRLAYGQAAKKGWIKPPLKPRVPTAPAIKPVAEAIPLGKKPPLVKTQVTLEVPPQAMRAPTEVIKPPIRPAVPVGEESTLKLTELIKSAKPIRKETEILKHEELQKRAMEAAGILEKGEGREAFLRSKAALKGKLPQAEFAPPEVSLTPDDITGLFNKIRTAPDLMYFQRLNTSEALEKVLSGQLPTRGDIALLEKVFGTEFAKALLSKRPMGQKAWETFLDVWNVSRTLLASWDISASLRQGVVLAVKRPKVWGGAFRAQLKALVKEENALAIDRAIQTSKYAGLRAEAGLYHAPLTGVGAKITQREEVFASTLIQRFAGWWEKAPIVKKVVTAPLYPPAKGVRLSERAYITFLNKLRADYFDSTITYWGRIGQKVTKKEYEDLAKFINNASGRGNLGKLEESAPFLSGVFFSPRLQASRIVLFKDAAESTARVAWSIVSRQPIPKVAKEKFGALASFFGAGVAVLSVAKAAGAEVGDNPLSADFGKIKIGKTRLDIWGGFQQYARFMAGLTTGMRKSTITGETYEKNRMEMIQQFVRSKLMPSVSFFYDLAEGRTFIGEKMEADVQQAYQRLAPMFVQDMTDAIQAEGLAGGFVATPGALGIGIVTYDLPNWPELEEYFNLETTAERNAYRIANPENEAKLFILGRFTTLKTPQAKQHVLKLMEEHKIKPEDVRGYENVFGEGATPIEPTTGLGRTWGAKPTLDTRTWSSIKPSLDSSSLRALSRVWYGGGSLTPSEKPRLESIHRTNPMGQPNFNTWTRQTLRQSFENSLK